MAEWVYIIFVFSEKFVGEYERAAYTRRKGAKVMERGVPSEPRAGGDARKRKHNATAPNNVGVVIRENVRIEIEIVPNSPAVVMKKTRHEKRKETLVNYKQELIKPEKDYAS
ncbi:uncharacterized protein LOC130996158 [Salvia miltiorrhiza]|uniref:uncharacterized protein LOC130996158 n=1 Tax=Salvia miltiorrhiza TaxID=226208 RepID=UPI0025AD1103|nr:uncharacterized protein LOC130996158 [Salvia miltiorrhiza]